MLRELISALSERLEAAHRRRAAREFTCADCDRNARCGREPGADCIYRAEQLSHRIDGLDGCGPRGARTSILWMP